MVHPRFIVPSVISIIALCIGLSSIKFAINNQFDLSVLCVTAAATLDAIDGRIARLIKGTSKFGAELDSLIDFINFGVAPAIVVYFWSLKSFLKQIMKNGEKIFSLAFLHRLQPVYFYSH